MKKFMLLMILGSLVCITGGCHFGECWREAWGARRAARQQPSVVMTEPCVVSDCPVVTECCPSPCASSCSPCATTTTVAPSLAPTPAGR
ncbi:MAG: hypothetical protein LLF97_10225 [Planctomycetaceae bacterium]|nr:hypothetical protein [Planctomycetaceae bacterium]